MEKRDGVPYDGEYDETLCECCWRPITGDAYVLDGTTMCEDCWRYHTEGADPDETRPTRRRPAGKEEDMCYSESTYGSTLEDLRREVADGLMARLDEVKAADDAETLAGVLGGLMSDAGGWLTASEELPQPPGDPDGPDDPEAA